MLKEMREAGFPGGLVGAADFVPDHVGDDRRAMIRNDDDLKTVVQGKMRNLGAGRGASSDR